MLKILIGTPIHICKDYAMERWLQNVSKLEYPADFFMVDNSLGFDYVEKVKGYCAKYGIHPVRGKMSAEGGSSADHAFQAGRTSNGIHPVRGKTSAEGGSSADHAFQAGRTSNGVTNYKIEHLELPKEQDKWERVARSREIIRQEFLSKDYDAWFAWDCDQIIPVGALGKLVQLMEEGNYMMVNPNKWNREIPGDPNIDFGCSLIKRECLEKYGFILEFGTDPDMPNSWEPGEAWFRKRVLRGGGNYINVYGIINPIYHLNK